MSDLRSEEVGEADRAAEYVLGVLGGAERRAAERQIERDPVFARAVDGWNARLAPFYEAIEPVEPPAGVWPRIAEELARMRRLERPGVSPAKPKGRRVSGIWQWIGLSGMGLAAASLAALIVVAGNLTDLGGMGGEQATPADFILAGTLASDNGQPLFTVVFYSEDDHDVATLIPVASPADGGRVPELWVVPPDGAAPRSLGLLHASQPVVLDVSNRQVVEPDAALAVSMEPAGGSPTGLPTGPVVAHGALRTP
ncbi:anti-sigma factor [Jiella avicenniae]|uniref:Anti-sigma factor n=1 Tax=Jiella avicenniae TaxID=2907202 RepID=A0A9X1NVS3_9HYPH|nr:anti-sigma factor [Jiella avicenniae]MCE7026595.1 anti-sigma factor [Jiella avicenniae]